ncbi:hypothetical protein C5B42_00010 [Candidatus Cerribacteria bacterium 'Amazon FNV 2010 28 9']|uniref:Uncharacterized protein n=1 Tax=Candidatus Cerribacteria bacterium 'Amazon FNV 2010 28 9' TaxID=2081795 RepID=A0A317JRS4_9BACT|nr:MAG: hypothetical protein C5B42_00010 [Candidatus Cerribacteria bacterium 'Amazon FNV 2010 28 9']
MNIESQSFESKEKRLTMLKSVLQIYETQLEELSANQRAHHKATPDFIGYGIAESMQLNNIIRDLKKQITQLEKE